ncbi:MAG TPA: acetate--CoA ligase family protein [Actinomycetota bacterium]
MTSARALRPLLAPRSIAIVGASEAEGSWAPEFYENLRAAGFEGPIFPVNPKYREVWGFRCVPTAADLPEGVDLAVIVVPARHAVSAAEDAARAGVRSAMVVSSGFAEAGGEGAAMQEALAAAARRAGMPVVGPNVEGYVNVTDRVWCYGTGRPPSLVPGGLTIVSQSGTVAWSLAQMAADRALGVRLVMGVGNEASVGLADMLAWAAADPETTVVACYVETVRDPAGFAKAAEALAGAEKPLLVCAPGHGEIAGRAVVAHTGAVAGRTGVRDAWLRRLGAALVPDSVALFEAAALASRATPPKRRGVAVAFQSGGSCTLFAEHAEAAGLEMPPPSAATRRRLRRALPPFAKPDNPLDVTGQAAVETGMFEAALEALARDPAIGVVAFDAFPSRDPVQGSWEPSVLAAAERLAKETGTVMVSLAPVPLALDDAGRKSAEHLRLPVLQGIQTAPTAIRALLDLSETPGGRAQAPHPARRRAAALLRGRSGALDEVRARKLLGLYGIEAPDEAVAHTPQEAAPAAARLGFPVAVKALAAALPHKARAGAVKVGLRTGPDVERAAAAVLRAARRAGVEPEGVLVQRMASGAEVLVGGLWDERFGPAVTVKPGGAAAEAGEAEFLAAPLRSGQAAAFVGRRAARLGLERRRHDLRAVAAALDAVARLLVDLKGRLVEIEANPLIVSRRGAVAVDALAVVSERA